MTTKPWTYHSLPDALQALLHMSNRGTRRTHCPVVRAVMDEQRRAAYALASEARLGGRV